MAGENDDARRALEVMNAYLQFDENEPESMAVFTTVMQANLTEPQGAKELVTGLLKLSGVLLKNIEHHTGDSPDITLQLVARVLTERDGGASWT